MQPWNSILRLPTISSLVFLTLIGTTTASRSQSMEAVKAKITGTYQDAFDRVIVIWKITIGQGFDLNGSYNLKLRTSQSKQRGSGDATTFTDDATVDPIFEVHHGALYVNGGSVPTNQIWNSAAYI